MKLANSISEAFGTNYEGAKRFPEVGGKGISFLSSDSIDTPSPLLPFTGLPSSVNPLYLN